jgi:hypothetical protein
MEKIEQAHYGIKKQHETLKNKTSMAVENLRRVQATMATIEAKVDSTTFD